MQHGLGQNNRPCAFKGHTCVKVMSAVSHISGCMFSFVVFKGGGGDHTVLTLETRNQQLFVNYNSVETVAGTSATANTPDSNKSRRKRNPARTRRSRLRLENFLRRKEEEKEQETGTKIAAGDSSNTSSKLAVQLSNEKKDTVEVGPHSPILQVDGQDGDKVNEVLFTFKSEYGEEDIRFSLGEIFPPFVARLDSRVRLGRLAA